MTNCNKNNIKRSELNSAIKRYIKEQEQMLDRTCRTIWTHVNPLHESILFGSFCKNRNRLIVTIGMGNSYVVGGFVPCR